MADFTHASTLQNEYNDDYDEIDASVDEAGFTDWSAEHDEDHTNHTDVISTIQQDDSSNDRESDGLYYYAESARGDQLIEVFVSPIEGSEYTSIEAMVESDKIKYGFDWKALIDNLTCQKDELLLISIINYIRRTQSRTTTTCEQASLLFDEIIKKIDDIRADDNNLQPQLDNDALLYSLPDYLGITNWSDEENEEGEVGIIIPPAAISLESNEEREARLQDVRNELGLEHTPTSSSATPAANDNNDNNSGKPIAGATYPYSEIPTQHTWSKTNHQNFQLRIGPNYDWNKKKAPSKTPLYEIFAVDIFSSESRIDHITEKIQMPSTAMEAIESNKHPHVPSIFVVQVQIPSDKPPMFSTVEDGPGWSIVMYFKITNDTLNALNNMNEKGDSDNNNSAAVKLFSQWCEHAHQDAAWRGRFKVIASCSNLTELGMPSMVTSYNAKPVLIRKTSTIHKTPQYIETCIHVFKFANMAKSPIHMCTSRCGYMDMEIGFTIEGRADHELPECLIGCAKITKPQESLTKRMVI